MALLMLVFIVGWKTASVSALHRDMDLRHPRRHGDGAGAQDAEGWTYATGDGIEVTVTFSETVKVEWRPSSAGIATTGSRSTTGCTARRALP